MTAPYDAFDVPMPLLHGDRPEGPQWRACSMRLSMVDTDAPRHQRSVYLTVKVRPSADLDPWDHLLNSPAFVSHAAQVLAHILERAGMLSSPRFLRSGTLAMHTVREIGLDLFESFRAQRGGGAAKGRIPSMTLRAPFWLATELDALSAHERMALATAARTVALERKAIARRFVPTGAPKTRPDRPPVAAVIATGAP